MRFKTDTFLAAMWLVDALLVAFWLAEIAIWAASIWNLTWGLCQESGLKFLLLRLFTTFL